MCPAKETANNLKRQPMEGEKILANLIRGQIPKYIFKLHLTQQQKKKILIEKSTEDLNRYFSKDDVEINSQQVREKELKVTSHQRAYKSKPQ